MAKQQKANKSKQKPKQSISSTQVTADESRTVWKRRPHTCSYREDNEINLREKKCRGQQSNTGRAISAGGLAASPLA